MPVGCCRNNGMSEHLAASPRELSGASRRNSSIYCSNNCYHLRTSTFLLSRHGEGMGRGREGVVSEQSSYLHKRRAGALDDIRSRWYVHGRNARKVDDIPRNDPYLCRNCAIDRASPILTEVRRNSGLASLPIYQRYVSK